MRWMEYPKLPFFVSMDSFLGLDNLAARGGGGTAGFGPAAVPTVRSARRNAVQLPAEPDVYLAASGAVKIAKPTSSFPTRPRVPPHE